MCIVTRRIDACERVFGASRQIHVHNSATYSFDMRAPGRTPRRRDPANGPMKAVPSPVLTGPGTRPGSGYGRHTRELHSAARPEPARPVRFQRRVCVMGPARRLRLPPPLWSRASARIRQLPRPAADAATRNNPSKRHIIQPLVSTDNFECTSADCGWGGSMVRRLLGPMTHWSDDSSFRNTIGPMTHWSEKRLVPRPICPMTIGRKTYWSNAHFSDDDQEKTLITNNMHS